MKFPNMIFQKRNEEDTPLSSLGPVQQFVSVPPWVGPTLGLKSFLRENKTQ